MSKRSQAKRSGGTAEQLTFFAAGFPANPQASPESEKEPPIIAGSGLTFCAWCLKSNPCGCWRRTLAECLAWTLRECNSANGLRVSLRLEVTNSYPSSWLLKTLAHRTEGSACSSWRTPTAEEAGARMETLFTKDGQPATTGQRAYRLQPDGRSVLQSVTLNQQVAMWPTPTVCGNNNQAGSSPKAGNGLATEAKIWVTPNRTDAKGGSRKGQGQEQLCFQVKKTDGQPDPDSPNTNGKSCALLNPRWVAQLQGFPSDWLDGIE